MRALAIMWVYNEADILGWTIKHLMEQGVDVYALDNWSTDTSWQVLERAVDRWGPERVRRSVWPTRPTTQVSWAAMLDRTARVALDAQWRWGYTWMMHHDADEIRRSTRYDERLVDALTRFEAYGWNAVDHDVQVYAPWDGYDATVYSPEEKLLARIPDHIDMRNGQVKCWRQPEKVLVDLSSSAGHDVQFPGRELALEPLVLKHYPFRTASQKARKLAERAARWAQEDRDKGWHVQYQQETPTW